MNSSRSSSREIFLRTAAFIALTITTAMGACTTVPAPLPDRPPIPPAPARDQLTAAAYPTVSEIYQGAQGIYRGCGPNGNVCHNSRQYPNMNTLGALVLNINQPCNQLQDDPTRIDDWCERQGDTVVIAGQRLTLAYLHRIAEATDTMGSRWEIVTLESFPAVSSDDDLSIVRVNPGRDDDQLARFDGSQLTADPTRPNVLVAQVDMGDDDMERTLARAGLPADRDAIQFGDPNRNGVFGVGLDYRLIYAGHPERSYIIRRLTDPTAGPLMPLANCCFWSKQSLRALWCWIAALRPDGSNAMDPIDYNLCPEGPVENVAYPEPGPMCENGGLCPVHTRDPVPDDPTWANVYGNIIVPRCGGNGCHRSTLPAGSLDMGTSQVAYDQLVNSMPPRVVPGSHTMSLLWQRIGIPCDPMSTTCRRMPLSQAPLSDHDIGVIAQWIDNGARMDGMITDAGPPSDGATDASDIVVPVDAMGTDASDIVVTDTGPADTGPADTGPLDTGPADTGPADSGVVDTGDPDAGVDADMDAAE
jgi:hypothetical protein